MRDADAVIVGAGAAGLSLAHRLCAPSTGPGPRVVLVDAPPGPRTPPERTWCYWESPGGAFDGALTASWERLRVHGPGGAAIVAHPAPFRYKMLRSRDFEALVGARLSGRDTVVRVEATVESVRDVPGGAEVRGRDASGRPVLLRARWAFDSRPAGRLPPARTTLRQHFRGWFVRTGRPAFDPATADLMDFRTPQPDHGLSFGYVLPLSDRAALVEYTEFSRRVADTAAYERALRHYTERVLRLGPFHVTATEQGAIPMTDGRFPRRAGRAVFRIGTAGGATRASTGYTFAAVQRQSALIAAALRAGRAPVPPPAHSPWHRALDAVLLRALDSGRVDGAEFFTGLFRTVPTARLLRFLDGRSRLWEDLSIGLHSPVLPMLRTVAELPLLPRRAALW
ncbi:lycopene cyclase [Streptomyces sioyaensis]|uniref:Lycopene cyclase n=1 Tax=Streptomyces sioyaensis TaxID=67364 RepID=A0A4Q1R758_9ACTN|nr:lycopene cyclase family protein [Streptomyces sioyaensis]MBM4791680.1 lycopene cyclase [Streptomyces sioyaensis]RXS69142.1 lycopene cyclase [Streptomyces sioyaensis]